MILSRQVARRRIAAEVRPGWIGAWGLVLADTLMLLGLMALVFWAARGVVATWPTWAAITLLVLVFFIPTQIVLITSALWAAKSRWTDDSPPPPPQN